MSPRTFVLAVTGFVLCVAACSTYGTSTVEVKAPQHVALIAVALSSPTIRAGQTQRATATLKDASGAVLSGRSVVWSTSSPAVATADDSGLIAAVAPGTAVVMAAADGVTGQTTLTVAPPTPAAVAALSVAISPAAVVVGQTAHATATVMDSAGNPLANRTITWQSANVSVAVVAANGDVSAVGAGTTAISAASEGKTASATLSVSAPAPVPVASVSVSPASSNLQVGNTVALSATTRDASGNVLTGRVVGWSSSNASVASVSANGVVTAVAGGSATITGSSEGMTGTAAITVATPAPPAVASVSVSPSSATVQIGNTQQLSATTRDASSNVLTGRVVSWSSATPSIASVNASSGLVTAVAAGTVQITATSEGKTGTASITVPAPAPAPVASVSVSPSSATVQIGNTQQLSATTRDAGSNILTGRVVTWSSATPSIASVNSSSGMVTAVAAGTVQITATSEGKTGTASITVPASAPAPVASVSVSPSSATVQVGNTQQLSATTRDASGNLLTGRAVTWSSATPSIASVNSSSGLVTAVAAGSVQITATSEGITGTSAITVPTVTPPPPPPSGSSNEPAGMTFVAERSFSALQEGSWYTNTDLSIVQDATAPKSPSGVLRATFPAGYAGGTSPGPAELNFSRYKTLYVSYWAKYSANWQGHLTGINKHAYAWVNGTTSSFVMEAEGYGSGALKPRPILQSMVVGDGPYPPNLVPGATITRDTWFHIEIVIVGNSSGRADGSMDIYLDGVHVTSATGLQWSSGAAQFNIFQFYPIWGGISDTVNSTMWFEWDHVYVSGKN